MPTFIIGSIPQITISVSDAPPSGQAESDDLGHGADILRLNRVVEALQAARPATVRAEDSAGWARAVATQDGRLIEWIKTGTTEDTNERR